MDAVSKLSEKGLVVHEKYGYLTLSKREMMSQNYLQQTEQIFKFLNEVLGIDEETSERCLLTGACY